MWGCRAPSATKATCPVLTLPFCCTAASWQDRGYGEERISH